MQSIKNGCSSLCKGIASAATATSKCCVATGKVLCYDNIVCSSARECGVGSLLYAVLACAYGSVKTLISPSLIGWFGSSFFIQLGMGLFCFTMFTPVMKYLCEEIPPEKHGCTKCRVDPLVCGKPACLQKVVITGVTQAFRFDTLTPTEQSNLEPGVSVLSDFDDYMNVFKKAIADPNCNDLVSQTGLDKATPVMLVLAAVDKLGDETADGGVTKSCLDLQCSFFVKSFKRTSTGDITPDFIEDCVSTTTPQSWTFTQASSIADSCKEYGLFRLGSESIMSFVLALGKTPYNTMFAAKNQCFQDSVTAAQTAFPTDFDALMYMGNGATHWQTLTAIDCAGSFGTSVDVLAMVKDIKRKTMDSAGVVVSDEKGKCGAFYCHVLSLSKDQASCAITAATRPGAPEAGDLAATVNPLDKDTRAQQDIPTYCDDVTSGAVTKARMTEVLTYYQSRRTSLTEENDEAPRHLLVDIDEKEDHSRDDSRATITIDESIIPSFIQTSSSTKEEKQEQENFYSGQQLSSSDCGHELYPPSIRRRDLQEEDPDFVVGDWGKCRVYVPCMDGQRQRVVECHVEKCNGVKPAEIEPCYGGHCADCFIEYNLMVIMLSYFFQALCSLLVFLSFLFFLRREQEDMVDVGWCNKSTYFGFFAKKLPVVIRMLQALNFLNVLLLLCQSFMPGDTFAFEGDCEFDALRVVVMVVTFHWIFSFLGGMYIRMIVRVPPFLFVPARKDPGCFSTMFRSLGP